MSKASAGTDPAAESASEKPIWTYKDYSVGASQFVTALSHFYRGELSRSNTWRSRLDATTNWAVVTAGAALTFTFSSPESPHFVLLLVILLLLVFLGIEARRYRYYELWAHRVRLMETDFFAGMLLPPYSPSPEWAEALADSLLQPEFTISRWEAIGRRFRRNYIWVFALLAVSWILKLFVHPIATSDIYVFTQRAAVGPVPGLAVLIIGLVFYAGLLLMGLITASLQQSTAEVLQEEGGFLGRFLPRRLRHVPGEIRPRLPGVRPRRHYHMITLITGCGEAVSKAILEELECGVTRLAGQGMYTGQPRDVLLCVAQSAQIVPLKVLARRLDPNALIVVSPANEVAGRRFSSPDD